MAENEHEARVQEFSQVVSRALVEIEPNEERRTFLLDQIAEAKSDSGSANLTEAGALVETLDKLVQNIHVKAVRLRCLHILSKVCRERVILPESYIISDISSRERRSAGGAADVWAGKRGQGDVCIKVFRQQDTSKQQIFKGMFYYHAIQWKYLSHDNVLPFLGISEAIPPFGLVSPWMPNRDILEYTRNNPDAERLPLLANAACGLKYLHSVHIVHGGINPGNILITGEGTARIGDYGIAGMMTDPVITRQASATTFRRGIVRYMAPEQVNPRKIGMPNSDAVKESDVYSFAMTAYRVLTETEPYAGITGEGKLGAAIAGDNRPPHPGNAVAVSRWLPDPVWKMLESCWVQQPQSRLSVEEVYQVLQGSIVHLSVSKHEKPAGIDPQQTQMTQATDNSKPLVAHKIDTPNPPVVEDSDTAKSPAATPPAKRGFFGSIRRLLLCGCCSSSCFA